MFKLFQELEALGRSLEDEVLLCLALLFLVFVDGTDCCSIQNVALVQMKLRRWIRARDRRVFMKARKRASRLIEIVYFSQGCYHYIALT